MLFFFLIKHCMGMGGVDRIHRNVDRYSTAIHSNKCLWPIFALIAWIVASARLATGSRRKLWTGPTIFSPSATPLKELSSPVVLVYYHREVQQVLLHLRTWFLNESSLTGWTASISSGPPSQSVLVAEWQQNTDTASVMMAYMADAASCSTQSELLFGTNISIRCQTFWH